MNLRLQEGSKTPEKQSHNVLGLGNFKRPLPTDETVTQLLDLFMLGRRVISAPVPGEGP